MAKLVTMFLILIALQAALILYSDQSPQQTDIWTFIWNVQNWSSMGFFVTLAAIASAVALAGITGNALGIRLDILIFAPAVAGLIALGIVFTNFANAIRDELIARIFTSCGVSEAAIVGCTPATFLVAIIIGPIAFYYAWTIIEWWRGKDM